MNRLLAQSNACEARIERIVEFAHRQLSLDAAYLSEFRDGRRLYRAVAGDTGSFRIAGPHRLPTVATYDQRMFEGEIPSVVRDTSSDERVADLFVTPYAGIGAYVGVPIRLSDGTVYGALARFPGPFGPPDETFAIAENVGLGLELERAAMRRACAILPRLAPAQFLALNASPAALLEVARGAGQIDWPTTRAGAPRSARSWRWPASSDQP